MRERRRESIRMKGMDKVGEKERGKERQEET